MIRISDEFERLNTNALPHMATTYWMQFEANRAFIKRHYVDSTNCCRQKILCSRDFPCHWYDCMTLIRVAILQTLKNKILLYTLLFRIIIQQNLHLKSALQRHAFYFQPQCQNEYTALLCLQRLQHLFVGNIRANEKLFVTHWQPFVTTMHQFRDNLWANARLNFVI